MMAYVSPLRYPGGKGVLAPFLESILKLNNIKTDSLTFIEPFAGGAGAALNLLTRRAVHNIHINDLDENVYNFWKSLLEEYSRFIQRIKDIDLSIDEWKKQKAILEDKYADSFRRGFAFFYLNRTNHSGIINARPIGGLEQKGTYRLDARFNKKNLINRMDLVASFRGRITITNQDGIEVIRDNLQNKRSFLYIDPPYIEQGRNLYTTFHDNRKHKELAELLKEALNFHWLVSYDRNAMIKELYSNKSIHLKEIYHRLNRRKHENEYIICDSRLKMPIEN